MNLVTLKCVRIIIDFSGFFFSFYACVGADIFFVSFILKAKIIKCVLFVSPISLCQYFQGSPFCPYMYGVLNTYIIWIILFILLTFWVRRWLFLNLWMQFIIFTIDTLSTMIIWLPMDAFMWLSLPFFRWFENLRIYRYCNGCIKRTQRTEFGSSGST